jgi:hypothetical protein
VHIVGFVIRKFVTMHGHMNVKFPVIVYSHSQAPRKETLCVNATLQQAYRENGGRALLILKLGTRWMGLTKPHTSRCPS